MKGNDKRMILPCFGDQIQSRKDSSKALCFFYSLEEFQKWEVTLSSGSHLHCILRKLWNVGTRSTDSPQKGHWADRWVKIMLLKWWERKWCSSSIQTVERVLCHWPQWQKIKLSPIKGKKPSILVSPAGTWKLLSVWKNGRALEKTEVSVLMTVFAPPGEDGSLF